MQRVVKTWLPVAAMVAMCHGVATAQALKLEATYIDHGYNAAGQAIRGGSVRTAVGPMVAIVCPGAAGGCTIQANHSIQVGHGSSSGNQYTVGFYVDGVANGDEQILGSTPSDGTYAMGVTSEFQTNVATGTHTVQTYIYSLGPTHVFNYTTNFLVYKP